MSITGSIANTIFRYSHKPQTGGLRALPASLRSSIYLACRKTEKHHRLLQKKLERFCGRKHLSQRDTSEQVMTAPGTAAISALPVEEMPIVRRLFAKVLHSSIRQGLVVL